MLSDVLNRLRALLRRRDLDRELEQEIEYHLEREAGKMESGGSAPIEAARQARLAFGGVEGIKEECREARGTALIESIAADVRYAARGLKKSPAFTLATVLSLAVGIGANTALFSLFDRVVLRPLPVERPEELVILRMSRRGQSTGFTYPFFQEMQARQTVLQGVFASSDYPLNNLTVPGSGASEAASCRLVSGDYFKVLGVRAAAGRVLDIQDDRSGAAGTAVISDRFWERRFQRGKEALGTSVTINQAQVTIVGIAPPEFFGEKPGTVPDLWVPLALQPKVMPSDLLKARFATWLTVMGRLKPEVPERAAAASLTSLAVELREFTIQETSGAPMSVALDDGARGLEDLRREFGRPLGLLMALAGLVLSIASFNMATMLLARGGARVRELGVRLALGAGRARLVRQMLTESMLLASAGGLAGTVLALWLSDALIRLAGQGQGLLHSAVLDGKVLVFSFTITAAATLLFGLLPAWLTSSAADPARSIGAPGRTATTPRRFVQGAHTLMAFQIAVSLVVVCGAALLTRSLRELRHQDFGLQVAGLSLVKLPMELTTTAMKRQDQLRGEAIERIRKMPGVVNAALSCCGPFDDVAHTSKAIGDTVWPGQRPAEVLVVHVSDGYVETTGMRLLSGRTFTAEDRKNTPKVALLTERAAAMLFAGAPATGRRISFGDSFNGTDAMEVAGILKDARFGGPRDEFRALVVVPMAQQPAPVTSISIRSSGEVRAAEIRKILEQTARGIGLGEISTYEQVIEKKLRNERMLSLLSGLFAAQVLALASLGLFGLTWFTAAGRQVELGVRAALGARKEQLTGLLLRRTAWLLLIGASIGALGAVALARMIRGFLFGVSTQDPVSFGVAVLVLALTGLAAAFVPAWRAACADPLKTLRAD